MTSPSDKIAELADANALRKALLIVENAKDKEEAAEALRKLLENRL